MRELLFFGQKIHPFTLKETLDLVSTRIESKLFTQLLVVNVATIVEAQTDKMLAASIAAGDIVNVDGMGVVWGARFLGYDIPERVPGVVLFEELLKLSAERGRPVFLLGATDEVVKRSVAVVQQKYSKLNVAGYHHGFFWDDEAAVVNAIFQSKARLLFVAITSPMKENFINRWREQLGVDFVMGVGGAFDVISGKVNRAPTWMQEAGLEWCYRLLQEPKRMWRRYLTTNSKFAFMLFKAKCVQLFTKYHD